MREQHLDRHGIALGVLEPLGLSTSSRNLDLGSAMCSAINDWQLDVFVEPEPRLRASIVVAPDAPDAGLWQKGAPPPARKGGQKKVAYTRGGIPTSR